MLHICPYVGHISAKHHSLKVGIHVSFSLCRFLTATVLVFSVHYLPSEVAGILVADRVQQLVGSRADGAQPEPSHPGIASIIIIISARIPWMEEQQSFGAARYPAASAPTFQK